MVDHRIKPQLIARPRLCSPLGSSSLAEFHIQTPVSNIDRHYVWDVCNLWYILCYWARNIVYMARYDSTKHHDAAKNCCYLQYVWANVTKTQVLSPHCVRKKTNMSAYKNFEGDWEVLDKLEGSVPHIPSLSFPCWTCFKFKKRDIGLIGLVIP